MKEKWKNIPNFEGYQVSNFGRVRTHNKTTYTKKHGDRHWKDRILKPKGQTYRTGYRVDLWKNGKPHTMLVARLIAFTFYDEDINNHKLTVDHIDGNRFNNNLENLELVSLAENIRRGFKNCLYHNQIKVKITNKKTKEITIFNSLNLGSKFIGKCNGYISNCIKKNKFENKDYNWECIK